MMSTLGLWVALCSVNCVRQLPANPAPPAVVPPGTTSSPTAQGQGRLIIDVVDGPTEVQRVHMQAKPITTRQGTHYSFHETSEPLCARTPCAVDLPSGNVLLGFPVRGDAHPMDIELVYIGEGPTVYRRELSYYRRNKGAMYKLGIIAASVGSASLITGSALLPIGLNDGNNGLTIAGAITLGAGALATTLGILGIRADSPTYRPGSANHFSLPATP